MVTGQTLLLPTKIKSYTEFPLAYVHLTLAHSKGQGEGHADFTVSIPQMVTNRANIVFGNKQIVSCWLSISRFKFDLGPF